MHNIAINANNNDLCSSCGVCAGICPSDSLVMQVDNHGDLKPISYNDTCINNCHICIDICPFTDRVFNPRKMNRTLYNDIPDARYHKNIGRYSNSYVGFRKNKALRLQSASGGLLTWCLEALIESKRVTSICTVHFSPKQGKGYFEYFTTSSIDEIRNAAGSVYHPVDISQIIKQIQASADNQTWAIVGVPCVCAAIRNCSSLRKKIPYVFGLACGMYQNTFYTELLLKKSGVDRENVLSIEYRRPAKNTNASNFRFQGTDRFSQGREIPYHGLPIFLGKNAFFRLNACNFCMDVFAETADACFMDAWLPEYITDCDGTSLVVTRNNDIDDLFIEGQSTGAIHINVVSPEKVVDSQHSHIRRKQELIFWRQSDYNPEKPNTRTHEKINWWIQKRSQRRSKVAWTKYGRKYGLFFFWIVMVDVILLNWLVHIINKQRRISRKIRDYISK